MERVRLQDGDLMVDVEFGPDDHSLFGLAPDAALRVRELDSGAVGWTIPDAGGFILSREGGWLATGIGENRARAWSLATKKPLPAIPEQPLSVKNLRAPSPSLLVSEGEDGDLRVQHVDTGVGFSFHEQDLTAWAVSPDNRTLATGSFDRRKIISSGRFEGIIRIREMVRGQVLRSWSVPSPSDSAGHAEETYQIGELLFSRDSSLLLSSNGQGSIRVWDPSQGRLVRSSAGLPVRALQSGFLTTASPDIDASIVILSRKEKREIPSAVRFAPLRVRPGPRVIAEDWQARSLVEVLEDGTIGSTRFAPAPNPLSDGEAWVALSPSGKLLASAGGDGVRVWDFPTGKVQYHFPLAADSIWGVNFSGDGALLTSQAFDGTLRAIGTDLPGGMIARPGEGNASPSRGSVVATVSGQLLAALPGSESTRIVDLRTGKELAILPKPHWSTGQPVFSEDGSTVATNRYDPISGKRVTTVWALPEASIRLELESWQIPAILFSRDGRYLEERLGVVDAVHRVWDVASKTVVASLDVTAPAVSAFSPDGSLLATNSFGPFQLVSLPAGHVIRNLKGGESIQVVAFSQSGRLLVAGLRNGTVAEFDVATGLESRNVKVGNERINAIAVSSQGVVAVAVHGEGIRLFRLTDLEPVATISTIPGEGAAILVTSAGAASLLGEPGRAAWWLGCRAGIWMAPWEACRDRFESQSALEEAFRGTAAAPD